MCLCGVCLKERLRDGVRTTTELHEQRERLQGKLDAAVGKMRASKLHFLRIQRSVFCDSIFSSS